MRLRIVVALSVLLAVPGLVATPTVTYAQATGSITGRVVSVTGVPVSAAQVYIPEGGGLSVGGRDIIGLRPDVSDRPVELVASVWEEHQPELSPDGHWLAYTSNQLEREDKEVFVRPFPDVDSAAPVQISLEGGIAPFWAHSGREIFFVEPATRTLMSVELETSPGFRILDRRAVLTLPDDARLWDVGQPYDVTQDDSTFLMLRTIESDSAPERPVLVVENWVQELYERLSN
jgi:hypothetical protein